MSAFLCDPRHIGDLASWYAHVISTDVSPIATALAQANLDSVEARYPDTRDEGAAKGFNVAEDNLAYLALCQKAAHNSAAHHIPLVEIIKAVHCLNYQSCEVDGWDSHSAKYLLDRIEAHAVRKLPGYDEAPWERTAHRATTVAFGLTLE